MLGCSAISMLRCWRYSTAAGRSCNGSRTRLVLDGARGEAAARRRPCMRVATKEDRESASFASRRRARTGSDVRGGRLCAPHSTTYYVTTGRDSLTRNNVDHEVSPTHTTRTRATHRHICQGGATDHMAHSAIYSGAWLSARSRHPLRRSGPLPQGPGHRDTGPHGHHVQGMDRALP
jgi:hypothetical protein